MNPRDLDFQRWADEYRNRWRALPHGRLLEILNEAEAAHDYRRALAVRAELARRQQWAHDAVRSQVGGHDA